MFEKKKPAKKRKGKSSYRLQRAAYGLEHGMQMPALCVWYVYNCTTWTHIRISIAAILRPVQQISIGSYLNKRQIRDQRSQAGG